MTRRVTIPDDHVALILPNQLSDELMSLLRAYRAEVGRVIVRAKRTNCELDSIAIAQHSIAGDVMLAILEAREA